MKKGINKGFSLVELIVVVLIMAIIAVVLAPQVTKWVQNSRQSSDLQTMDSMTEFAQLAMTDADAYAESADGIEIRIEKGSTTIKNNGTGSIATFVSKIEEYAGLPTGSFESTDGGKTFTSGNIKAKADGTVITIDAQKGSVVPTSNIENDDLEVEKTNSETPSNPNVDPDTTPSPNTPAPAAKTVSITNISVEEGGQATLTASFTGYSSDPEVEWSINPASGVVEKEGTGKTITLKAQGTKGQTATITVSVKEDSSINDTCTVTITEVAEYEIEVSATNTTIYEGEQTTVSAKVTPAFAASQVKWTSSDNTKATVDNSGVVTAKKPGKVTITGTIGEGEKKKTDTVEIEVKGAPAEITIKHVFKNASGTEIDIKSETIHKGTDNKYTSAYASSDIYNNLTRESTVTSFTASATEAQKKIVWVAKSGWGTSFEAGGYTGNTSKITYPAKIKIDSQYYVVFENNTDLNNTVQYYGEDVNLLSTLTYEQKKTAVCTLYKRDQKAGNNWVTLKAFTCKGSGGAWKWTEDKNKELKVFIAP